MIACWIFGVALLGWIIPFMCFGSIAVTGTSATAPVSMKKKNIFDY